MVKLLWECPAQLPDLQNNDVHVWSVDLQVSDERRADLWHLLNAAERARVERLQFLEHRQRAIVSKGVLREILAHYLKNQPESIELTAGPHGKPQIASLECHFNLSHSHDIAVYAVSKAFLVGIDVEYLCKDIESLAIAERWFTESEYQAIVAAPADKQRYKFFNFWTCKEAVVKAIGKGLSLPLNQFTVEGINTSQLKLSGLPEVGSCNLYWFKPAEHYTGALAVLGNVAAIYYGKWPS